MSRFVAFMCVLACIASAGYAFPEPTAQTPSLFICTGKIGDTGRPVLIGNTMSGYFRSDSLEQSTQRAKLMIAGFSAAFQKAGIPVVKAELCKPSADVCNDKSAMGYRLEFTPPKGWAVTFTRAFPEAGTYYGASMPFPCDTGKVQFFADTLTKRGFLPIGAVIVQNGYFELFHLTKPFNGIPVTLKEANTDEPNPARLLTKPTETFMSYLKKNNMVVFNYDEGMLSRLVYFGPVILRTHTDPVLKKDSAALIKNFDKKYGSRVVAREITQDGDYVEVVYYFIPSTSDKEWVEFYSTQNF